MDKLTTILSKLLQDAEANPGKKCSHHLGNGLSIDVKIDGGYTYLQIHRSSVYPSRAEWNTILKRWPYPVQAEPKQIARGRYYLQSRWPSQLGMRLPGANVCAQTQEPK